MKTVIIYTEEDAENLASVLLQRKIDFSVDFQDDSISGLEQICFTIEEKDEFTISENTLKMMDEAVKNLKGEK